MSTFSVICVFLLIGLAFVPSKGDNVTEVATINQAIVSALENHDTDAFVALHTQDTITMADGFPTVYGSTNFNATLGWVALVGEVQMTTDEVGPAGDDFVFERKHFVIKNQEGQLMIDGKSVVIYKRVGDKLAIYIKISNSNA